MSSLNGKVALVTGASRGVGAAVARALAREGASLGLASRSGDDLGIDGAVAGPADVRRPEDLERIVAETVERFGRLDIVVANAGVGAYAPFLELDPQHVEEIVDVNVKGLLYTVRAALPHLLDSGEADVVTLASVAGLRGLPLETVYCASKFAQVGFTRSLDHELRERGVRATCICPGGVNTNFAIGTGRTEGDPELEGMLTADEVADVVLFTVTRPRHMRILTTSFRPVIEPSWG
jgi:NAD(P)-dependent dehydrogenase (short-subunit alcohol dehydrogenase family)